MFVAFFSVSPCLLCVKLAAFAGVPGSILGWCICDFFHFRLTFTSSSPFPPSLPPSFPFLLSFPLPLPSSPFPFPSPSDLLFALKNAFFAFIPIKQAKRTHFNKQTHILSDPKCSPSKRWQVARDLCELKGSASTCLPPLMDRCGKIVSESNAKADLLNEVL